MGGKTGGGRGGSTVAGLKRAFLGLGSDSPLSPPVTYWRRGLNRIPLGRSVGITARQIPLYWDSGARSPARFCSLSPASAVPAGTGHADKLPVTDPGPVLCHHLTTAVALDECICCLMLDPT